MGVIKTGQNGLAKGLFIFLSVVPCAVISGQCTWPFLLMWAVAGGVRWQYSDPDLAQDCWFFGLANIYVQKHGLRNIIEKSWGAIEGWSSLKAGLVAILPLATFGLFHQRASRGGIDPVSTSLRSLPAGASEWTLWRPKALIFPCKTTHARIFPKKHAFGYSYLLCGFPIVPAATTADGKDIGIGKDEHLGSSWLGVRAEDYLERGNGGLGFYGKLKVFLQEHDVEDSEWSYAYLVTAPRFFGYSFNPVSFWYIYDRHHGLKKMILEVNNTFGEKRMYLLDGSSPPSPPPASDSGSFPTSLSTDTRFTDIWMKDFHVSPFNSRKGSYALKALDPFPSMDFSNSKIDNTITLKSSKDHAKIVARVFTTKQSIDPVKMNILGTLRFIGSWWWVGLVTSPRIIREAFKLYFKRSLHVWFRPEVLSTSVGRVPTPAEEILQNVFQDYLDHLVQLSSEQVEIDFSTAIPDRPWTKIVKKESTGGRNTKKLELRVTTPAFYSRFVHYAHTSEALDRECLFTDEKNRTLWISHPELLPYLLPKAGARMQSESKSQTTNSFLDEFCWSLLRKLRCPPPEPAYAVTPKSTEFDVDDIRTLPYSDLDEFVRGNGRRHANIYRRNVSQMFLAQRFALGNPQIITFIDRMLRFFLCWNASKMLAWTAYTVGKHADPAAWNSSIEPALHLERLRFTGIEWWQVAGLVVFVCGCHIYGFAKGYR